MQSTELPEKIRDVIAEYSSEAGARLATGERRVLVRDWFREQLRKHTRELAAAGLDREHFERFESLLWDGVRQAVREISYRGKFLYWRFHQRLPKVDQPEDLADLFESSTEDEVNQFGTVDLTQINPPPFWWRRLLLALLPDTVSSCARMALKNVQSRYVVGVRTPLPVIWHRHLGQYETTAGEVTFGPSLDRMSANLVHAEDETWRQFMSPSHLDPERTYLYLSYEGHLSSEPERLEPPILHVRNELKSVLGLALAGGLVEVCSDHDIDSLEPIFVHDDVNSHLRMALRWLTPEESTVSQSLIPCEFASTQQKQYLKHRLVWIATALRRRSIRLLKAARWLFDSHGGTNDLLQLVQAITALEILLGNDEEDFKSRSTLGVTELLANRYAYSTHREESVRKRALRDFRNVYDARSRIVHSGKEDVGPALKDEARRMCCEVIRHELAIHAEVGL